MTEKIILGVDPGTLFMGYGLIKIIGNQIEMICLGEIKLNKLENQQLKLNKIFEKITQLIDQYKPDECAVECPFYGENAQSMLKLGRAQGVAMVACLQRGLPVAEYFPRKVKLSITGNGNATKEQVALMLQKLCNLKTLPKSLDATDALAVAVCHYFQNGIGETAKPKPKGKKNNQWRTFVSQNQDRILK